MKMLITGGAGFIGSNFIRLVREQRPADRLVNVDLLTYAGNLENLEGIDEGATYRFARLDVGDAAKLSALIFEEQPDAIVHFAAESHVDRSILQPAAFLQTNVIGTATLLDVARKCAVPRVLVVSTDEVYGSLGPTGAFEEVTPLAPSSPYSASKASADQLALAYHHTYGQDVVITRCSNNYGRYQFPEKLIPLMIIRALEGQKLPVYGDGKNVRDWIHVDDHCRGILLALEKGQAGRVYNLGGESERENLAVVRQVLSHLKRPESLIQYVTDRPGHDRRYAMNIDRARAELGFEPAVNFEEGLAQTIDWYTANPTWWQRVRDGRYQTYFEQNYQRRSIA